MTNTSNASGMANKLLSPLTDAKFSAAARHVTRLHQSARSDYLVVGWEPGQESSTHAHDDCEATIVILSGHVTIWDGSGQTATLGPGTVAVTPPGCPHKVTNDSEERAVTLHMYTPPMAVPLGEPFTDLSVESVIVGEQVPGVE